MRGVDPLQEINNQAINRAVQAQDSLNSYQTKARLKDQLASSEKAISYI